MGFEPRTEPESSPRSSFYQYTTAHHYPRTSPSLTEWSDQEVVEKYLKPINMEHLQKLFTENHINGAVLLALEVGGWGWGG